MRCAALGFGVEPLRGWRSVANAAEVAIRSGVARLSTSDGAFSGNSMPELRKLVPAYGLPWESCRPEQACAVPAAASAASQNTHPPGDPPRIAAIPINAGTAQACSGLLRAS